ncbi:MAG: hypothetical protein M1324_03925 [Patescibacteria group bacterium]|nr:hypothetical protein [Patescibacteria group bacterium]
MKLDKSQETIDTDSSDVFLIWSRDYGYTSNLMKFNTGNGKTTEVTQFRDQEVKVSENNRVIVGNDHNNPRLLIYDLANQSKLELISNNLRNSPYYDSSYNDGTFSNDQEYYFDKRFEIGENLLFFHQAGLKIKINIPDKKITTDLIPYKNVSLGKRNVHQNISEEKHYKISDNYYFSRKYTIKDNGDQYFAMSQCPKEYSFSGTEPDSFEADNDPCVKSAINNVIALKKSGESNFNIIFDLATGLPEKATMDGISRSIDERVITDFRQIPFADGLFVTLVNKIKSTPEEIKEKKDEESNGVYYSGETLYYQYTHTVLYVSENDVKKVNDFVTVINEKDGNEYYGENFFPYK